MSGGIIYGFAQVASAVDAYPTLNFFGVRLPWLVFFVLYEAPTLFFLFLASNRKMASERWHPYTKPEAVACMATFTVLLLGGVWDVSYEYLVLVVLYALVLGGNRAGRGHHFQPGRIRQGNPARSSAGAGFGPWDNLALNRLAMAVVCTIVLVGATTAWDLIEGPHARPPARGSSATRWRSPSGCWWSRTSAWRTSSCNSPSPSGAATFLGLFLFLVWLVPIILGAIAAAAGIGTEQHVPQMLFGLSPIAGISLFTGIGSQSNQFGVQAAAPSRPGLRHAVQQPGLTRPPPRRTPSAWRPNSPPSPVKTKINYKNICVIVPLW